MAAVSWAICHLFIRTATKIPPPLTMTAYSSVNRGFFLLLFPVLSSTPQPPQSTTWRERERERDKGSMIHSHHGKYLSEFSPPEACSGCICRCAKIGRKKQLLINPGTRKGPKVHPSSSLLQLPRRRRRNVHIRLQMLGECV